MRLRFSHRADIHIEPDPLVADLLPHDPDEIRSPLIRRRDAIESQPDFLRRKRRVGFRHLPVEREGQIRIYFFLELEEPLIRPVPRARFAHHECHLAFLLIKGDHIDHMRVLHAGLGRRGCFDSRRSFHKVVFIMKAIVVKKFGGPDVLQIGEVPLPRPAAGQVLVRVHAAGVNPVETYIRAGTYAKLPALPFTPGTDGAGVVEQAGEGVKSFAAGDRVWFFGTSTGSYAEYALCSGEQVHLLPERVPFAQGAAVGVPYPTAYRALFQRGEALPGETVLIHGATGGVGIAAVQLARAAGLTVLATGGTEQGRVAVLENGAHHVFDHCALGYIDEVMNATGNRGVDVILEMLANVNLSKDLALLAKNGRVVVIGSRGKIEIDPRDTMVRDADIRGMVVFNASAAEMAAVHAALGAGLENGALRPVVGREFPLADAARAHQAVMEPGALGKIVLLP